MRTRRLGGLTAICVIGSLACAGTAAAVPTVTVKNGVSYALVETTAPVGNGLSDSITSECPSDIYPLSGGFFSAGGFGETFVTGNIPVNAAPLDAAFDSWAGSWRGSPTSGYALDTLAVCDETKPSYAEKAVKVKAGKRKTVTVNCEGARHVYGGGIGSEILEPGPLLASSYPVDSKKDSDKTPDDGWRLSADNESTGEITLAAFAICGKVKAVYRSSSTNSFAVGRGSQHADCPAGKPTVIGGGQKVSGGYGDTLLQTSFAPSPYDFWVAVVDRFSPDVEKLRAFAVCVDDELQ